MAFTQTITFRTFGAQCSAKSIAIMFKNSLLHHQHSDLVARGGRVYKQTSYHASYRDQLLRVCNKRRYHIAPI